VLRVEEVGHAGEAEGGGDDLREPEESDEPRDNLEGDLYRRDQLQCISFNVGDTPDKIRGFLDFARNDVFFN
jgi:hypothetical protein